MKFLQILIPFKPTVNQFQRIVKIIVTLNNIDISVLSADILELQT